MLNLILAIMMCIVRVESGSDVCECDFSTPTKNNTTHFQLNEDQQKFLTLLETYKVKNVKFPNPFTVEIRNSELQLNLSETNLNWIKRVSLSENNLTTIPVFILDLIGVDSLDLSQNEIEFIDTELFRTLNLKQLNLSSNAISEINITSNLNNLTSLDLSRNELSFMHDVLVLPSLQYLNLSNNKLKVLNIAGLNSLQHLDVSRNQLVGIAFESIQLPNLTRLFVAGNTQLGKSRDVFVFVGTGKLETLDASRTGLKQVPAALTNSIQYLTLTGNLIRAINSGDLDAYPLLHLLDLTSNDINSIEEDSLGRLEFLSVLYLSHNQLVEIPRRLPEKLKVLHLSFNEIGTIRKKDLQGLPSLEVLLLNDNNVSVINEGAFSELISLVTLDLSRNPLINLESGSFAGPLSLETLRLSSVAIISTNSTNEDNPFPVSLPEKLVTLDLSQSPELARQFLSDTPTLMAAKRLQELDLSGGNLEYLRQDLQFFLPELKLLRIEDNKFNLTQINWLKSWLCAPNKSEKLIMINSTRSSVKILKQSELSELTTKNANEFDEFAVNEVYYSGVMSKFSNDLALPYEKNPLQERHNELVRSSLDERPVDKREDSIKWNVSDGEISMYTSEKKNYFYRSLLLVLSTALIVFTISVLLILRLFRIRRHYVEDIEATALPTISDIW